MTVDEFVTANWLVTVSRVPMGAERKYVLWCMEVFKWRYEDVSGVSRRGEVRYLPRHNWAKGSSKRIV